MRSFLKSQQDGAGCLETQSVSAARWLTGDGDAASFSRGPASREPRQSTQGTGTYSQPCLSSRADIKHQVSPVPSHTLPRTWSGWPGPRAKGSRPGRPLNKPQDTHRSPCRVDSAHHECVHKTQGRAAGEPWDHTPPHTGRPGRVHTVGTLGSALCWC